MWQRVHLIGRKINKFFCWGPWQLIIPVALAFVIAIGTVVESRYDAQAAGKLVYHTWWMSLLLAHMCLTLIAVMIDRWPWKWRHGPFLAAHVGILILLLGALLTKQVGLDGTMRFGIGEKNNLVTVPETDLTLWSSFDGDRYSKLHEQEVDFFTHAPAQKPLELPLDKGALKVVDYRPYALPSRQIKASPASSAGGAVRFMLSNEQTKTTEWLIQAKKDTLVSQQVGLAKVFWGAPPPNDFAHGGETQNELYLWPMRTSSSANKEGVVSHDDNAVSYQLFYKDKNKKPLKGFLREGEQFQTGWMKMSFQLLRYLPRAEESYDFKFLERPTPLTTSAILVKYQTAEEVIEKWVQLNDVVKFFSQNAVYILTYGNRRIDIGFELLLKKFEVGRYQGTQRAMSYQSLVETPEKNEFLISMNEPLKYKGLTFYQASFQDGPDGQPIASILSVNHDPGRWLKYLGSLVLSIGIVWLFYNKRRSARAAAPKEGEIL